MGTTSATDLISARICGKQVPAVLARYFEHGILVWYKNELWYVANGDWGLLF